MQMDVVLRRFFGKSRQREWVWTDSKGLLSFFNDFKKRYGVFDYYGDAVTHGQMSIVKSGGTGKVFVLVTRDAEYIHDLVAPFSPKVTIVKPEYSTIKEWVHHLFFIYQFATKDHSIVERDKLYLLPKNLETPMEQSWSNEQANEEMKNVAKNKVEVNYSTNAVDKPEHTMKRTYSGCVCIHTRSDGKKYLTAYDATTNSMIDTHSGVLNFLSREFRGPFGSHLFPRGVSIGPEGLLRRVRAIKPHAQTVIVFDEHLGMPPVYNFRGVTRDEKLKEYLTSRRSAKEPVPLAKELSSAEKALIRSVQDDEGNTPTDDSEEELSRHLRVLSIRSGFFTPLLGKMIHALKERDMVIDDVYEWTDRERLDGDNDTRLFFEAMERRLSSSLRDVFQDHRVSSTMRVIGKEYKKDGMRYVIVHHKGSKETQVHEKWLAKEVNSSRTKILHTNDIVPEDSLDDTNWKEGDIVYEETDPGKKYVLRSPSGAPPVTSVEHEFMVVSLDAYPRTDIVTLSQGDLRRVA